MKRKILSVFMAFSIFFMSQLVTSQKSEAVVALIVKNKTAMTISGISLGTTAAAYGIASTGVINFTLGGAILFALGVVTFGAISLIVLDDKTIADMEFTQMDYSNTEFSLEEIQMYNAEIEELNAIRKTMQSELGEKSTVAESKSLWSDYKEMLHPLTVKVAEKLATGFTDRLELEVK